MDDIKYEVSTLLYLQQLINSKIVNAITENVLRNKPINYDELRDSIDYVLDEQIGFIKNSKRRIQNDTAQ